MSDPPVVQYASRTDVGMRRAANQDSLAVRLCSQYPDWQQCGHLFVVSDGMGGHSVGDLASRISVDTLPIAYFKRDTDSIPERLLAAITEANRAINDKARENPEFSDMGTTCSTLVLSPQGAFVGHVGDSRVYRVRDGIIEQLSFDHSLQWEMVRQGRATIENVDMLHPRNVITRCLGPDQNVRIDIEGPFHVRAGDRFVICSDGLTGHVSDTEIGAVAANMPPTESARLLINLANCRGGADNVTVVVANVEKYPTIHGQFVDAVQPAATKSDRDNTAGSGVRNVASQVMLVLFLLLGLIGLGFLAVGNVAAGLTLICPAVILGFVRMIMVGGSSGGGRTESGGEDTTDSGRIIPAARSPYRRASAEIEGGFLEFLAEAQSELTQAACDNGWKVDVDNLASLNRSAVKALREGNPAQCLQLRGRAIDALMKELYSHTRRS